MMMMMMIWIGFGESVDVLFNSSVLWGALPAGTALTSDVLSLPRWTDDATMMRAQLEAGASVCVQNADTNTFIGLPDRSVNGTLLARLEVRHDEQTELLVRVNGQVQISLYTEPAGPLRIDAYNADDGALFNDTVLVAIGGRFPRPHNVGLFSIGCAWTSISCHCFLTFGNFSSDRLVMAPRQPQFVPFTRILGRWDANFCVKDVIVTSENLPAEAILSYVRGSGSTIVLTASSTGARTTVATMSEQETLAAVPPPPTTSTAETQPQPLLAIVVGSVGALLFVAILVTVAIVCFKRRRSGSASAATASARVAPKQNAPNSEYTEIKLSASVAHYESGNL
jgi:hypothetical protein